MNHLSVAITRSHKALRISTATIRGEGDTRATLYVPVVPYCYRLLWPAFSFLSLTIAHGQIVSYQNAQFFTDRGHGHRDLLGYHHSVATISISKVSCIVVVTTWWAFAHREMRVAQNLRSYQQSSQSTGAKERPIP